MNNRYYNSNRLIKDALRVIPLGSQTFSKSITAFPRGVSPLFIEKGLMAKVWDVDGNEYLDFINGLASVTMGYSNDEINSKVVEQLDKGVIFSLPNKVEIEVAKIIIDLVPSVDMVRFGKNGTDVTSAAIRLARAHTGRDHVLVCGYHGWHDWYIGSTTRNLGVPDVVLKGIAGGDITLTTTDRKNETSNDFSIVVGENAPSDFTYFFKVENLKLLSGDYKVEVSQKGISRFTNMTKDVEYFIALEAS